MTSSVRDNRSGGEPAGRRSRELLGLLRSSPDPMSILAIADRLGVRRQAILVRSPYLAYAPPMTDTPFVPYRIVLIRGGELSPAEDFDTAVIAAKQARAMGHDVWQIKQGDDVILEGEELASAMANDR